MGFTASDLEHRPVHKFQFASSSSSFDWKSLKMKLALLLLSCLVGLSCQQSYGLWPSPMGHRAAIYRNIYADQYLLPSVVQSFETQDSPLAAVNDGLGAISSVEGRVPAKFNPQQRLYFFGNLLPHQKTTTSTVTSTVTTVVINSCIQSKYLQATTACGDRRKREVPEALEIVLPSEVEKMVASVEPKMVERRSNDQPEILSSLQSTQDSDFNAASFYLRQQRLFNYPTYTVTSTKIVYTATTLKKAIFREPVSDCGGGGGGEVDDKCPPCLPAGFVLC